MGFTPDMFTVLFAIPRTAGWLAQWHERRDFVPLGKRGVKTAA